MDHGTRKGRPPADHDTPAYLKAATVRKERLYPVGAATEKLVDDYIEWSADKVNLNRQDAMYRFVDYVFNEFIRRDPVWVRHVTGKANAAAGSAGPATAAAPAAGTPALGADGTPPAPPPAPAKAPAATRGADQKAGATPANSNGKAA